MSQRNSYILGQIGHTGSFLHFLNYPHSGSPKRDPDSGSGILDLKNNPGFQIRSQDPFSTIRNADSPENVEMTPYVLSVPKCNCSLFNVYPFEISRTFIHNL